jgi:hypothetical protein
MHCRPPLIHKSILRCGDSFAERISLHTNADMFNIFQPLQFSKSINYLSSPRLGQSTWNIFFSPPLADSLLRRSAQAWPLERHR